MNENIVMPTPEESGEEGEIKAAVATLEKLLPQIDSVPLNQIEVTATKLRELLQNYPDDIFGRQARSILEQADELIKARTEGRDSN